MNKEEKEKLEKLEIRFSHKNGHIILTVEEAITMDTDELEELGDKLYKEKIARYKELEKEKIGHSGLTCSGKKKDGTPCSGNAGQVGSFVDNDTVEERYRVLTSLQYCQWHREQRDPLLDKANEVVNGGMNKFRLDKRSSWKLLNTY